MQMSDPRLKAARLSCWANPVDPIPLGGGITNTNFVVTDRGEKFVVRIGDDVPLHGILRFHELAASRAAHACGVSPEIVHHEPGALVMRFIDGRVLTAEDLRSAAYLERALETIRTYHAELARHLRGPTLMFWVFHVCRDYLETARAGVSRVASALPRLAQMNAELERALGPITPVFAHNDLLAANFIDDGRKIWLLDWEYAGWNTPLFDLANLATNNQLPPALEEWLLTTYFDQPADRGLLYRYHAARCGSLLRETLWSVVQEQHSTIAFDYGGYTDDLLARLEHAYATFRAQHE
jgi:thiamine kinase-like enzyme